MLRFLCLFFILFHQTNNTGLTTFLRKSVALCLSVSDFFFAALTNNTLSKTNQTMFGCDNEERRAQPPPRTTNSVYSYFTKFFAFVLHEKMFVKLCVSGCGLGCNNNGMAWYGMVIVQWNTMFRFFVSHNVIMCEWIEKRNQLQKNIFLVILLLLLGKLTLQKNEYLGSYASAMPPPPPSTPFCYSAFIELWSPRICWLSLPFRLLLCIPQL